MSRSIGPKPKEKRKVDNGKDLPTNPPTGEPVEMTLPKNAVVVEASPELRLQQFHQIVTQAAQSLRCEIRPFVKDYGGGNRVPSYEIIALK